MPCDLMACRLRPVSGRKRGLKAPLAGRRFVKHAFTPLGERPFTGGCGGERQRVRRHASDDYRRASRGFKGAMRQKHRAQSVQGVGELVLVPYLTTELATGHESSLESEARLVPEPLFHCIEPWIPERNQSYQLAYVLRWRIEPMG